MAFSQVPSQLDPANFQRVRLVEDHTAADGDIVGCKITEDALSTDPDTLFPLQGALGYDLVQHLFIAPHNLVLEGPSDFTYLSVMSGHLAAETERESLDERWSLVPVGGADLVPTFVALLGSHLDTTVLVDAQKGGHQRLSHLADSGLLSKKRIVTVGQVLGRKGADIEDLFESVEYLELYNGAFGTSIKPSDLTGSDPIVRQIARHQNVDRFNHQRPADYFLRNRDAILGRLSDATLDRFEELFVTLNATLPAEAAT